MEERKAGRRPNAVEIRDLTKYYGKARGIADMNMTVAEGEFFGFMGPNGAGKSTTIRLLLGLIRPSSGQTQVLGMDTAKDREEILSQTGYLPSESIFYNGMKVKDVLKLSADLRGKDCAARAEELCQRLRLDPNRKVSQLSFGNRKKTAIIAALQHNPRLLILDEPTSGLDPLMQRTFFSIIRELHQQETTIFLSSHVLPEIQRNCTRAVILKEGRIIADVTDLSGSDLDFEDRFLRYYEEGGETAWD